MRNLNKLKLLNIFSRLFYITFVGALFTFAHSAHAVFIEESANHFIWESGPISDGSDFGETGTFWDLEADFKSHLNPDSAVTIFTGLGADLYSADGISGDGNYSINSDLIGFFSLTASYFGAAANGQIDNVRVEGWLTDPNPAPDGGSTLILGAFSLVCLTGLRKKMAH